MAQFSGDSESKLAQRRRDARQAIAQGGTDYLEKQLIAGGMDPQEAANRARSAAVRDSVGILQAMDKAETSAGTHFENLPVAQQNAILREALANNGRSGPLLTEQLSRREASIEVAGDDGYAGVTRLPDAAPVVITGSGDLKTGFVRTAANVLDRTNAAVVELVGAVGGAENATAAAFGLQLAIGGIPRTALSYAGDYALGGVKEDLSGKLSNLIADKGFDVQSATPELASKINTVSNVLGRFGVDSAFSGASQFVHNAIDSRAILNAVGVVGRPASAKNLATVNLRPVELSFNKVTRTWTSPAGLDYGPGSVHGNRVKHVLDHAEPNPNKTMHSVFNAERKEILGLVDEAWKSKGMPMPGDPGVYLVPMGRAVGTAGETHIKIVVRPGTQKIITAYPFNN